MITQLWYPSNGSGFQKLMRGFIRCLGVIFCPQPPIFAPPPFLHQLL